MRTQSGEKSGQILWSRSITIFKNARFNMDQFEIEMNVHLNKERAIGIRRANSRVGNQKEWQV